MGQFCISFGYAMVVLFTQQTFHRESRAAKGVAWSVIGLLVVSLAARVLHEGFAISVSPGPFHWMGYGCRMFALVWATWASLRYWVQMRKRVQLGLADPLVSNRFLLWALWASGNCMTALAEPAARVAYDWFAGGNATSAEAIQGIGGPVITITLCISSLLAIYTTIVLWLAFFPSDRYRGWITERAQRHQAASLG
jgi:hypothetical protein